MAKEKKVTGAAKAAVETKSVANVVANAKLVEAIKGFDIARSQTKSYLIEMAEVIQNEQCTKAEVVASIMEARGVEKSTAESQYSRHRKLFTDPDTLERAKSGDIEVSTLREPANKQKNPSQKKLAENREKKFATAVKQIVTCAKEGGTDRATVINTITRALKDAGVK